MPENPVRHTLRAGGQAFGVMAFEFFTPGLAAVLAAGGAEFVILDTEHSGVGIDVIKAQVAFCRGAGIVPIVRVPGCERHLISPVLDAGAKGIMVPMVETRAQAERLVAFSRYRPIGKRGLAFGIAHDAYRPTPPLEAMAAANAAVLTIAMIETESGLRNAEEILAVPGIDLGWLGHFDLTDSLGIVGEFDHARYHEAEAALLAAAQRAGKPLGWLANNAAEARAALRRGYACLCLSTDLALLRGAVTAEFDALKRMP